MIDTNPIKIYDEKGKIVCESNPCTFQDTVVETAQDRIYTIHNTTKYKIELLEDNNDPTISYHDYPQYLNAGEKAIFRIRYHPTFEHLKATEEAIGFKFRVL